MNRDFDVLGDDSSSIMTKKRISDILLVWDIERVKLRGSGIAFVIVAETIKKKY
jgi:hypothetical protein